MVVRGRFGGMAVLGGPRGGLGRSRRVQERCVHGDGSNLHAPNVHSHGLHAKNSTLSAQNLESARRVKVVVLPAAERRDGWMLI